MTREQLVNASEELKHVSGMVEDESVKSRIDDQADQLHDLAEADHGPDHGRLDRHMHALSDLKKAVDDDLAEHIGHAYDEVKAYRGTVEGI